MLTVVRLYVDDNVICDDGAKCLAEMVVGHKSLKNFYIVSNYLTDEGAKMLAEAAGKNLKMERMIVCKINIGFL